MAEPRLYMYRKAGREVWDAEMWLPDGRRTTWRTGRADREDATHAARERLSSLTRRPHLHTPVNVEQADAVPLAGLVQSDACPPGNTPDRSPAPMATSRLQRLDAWFFSNLEGVFAEH